MSITDPIQVFYGGVTQAPFYRIPSITRTKNNVLVAVCDARFCGCMDNPNRIDKVVRRSFDDGATWGEAILAVEERGTIQKNSSCAIDPQLIYDESDNSITMLYAHTPAGIGIFNAKIGRGMDEVGNLILTKGLGKYKLIDGEIIDKKGRYAGYNVDKDGNITLGGVDCGNININGEFRQFPTFYIMMTRSLDDGATWSESVCINKFVKHDTEGFICMGPGRGIVLQCGEHKGRYVAPYYFGTRVLPFRMSCGIMYSDDRGATWQAGGSPNDYREDKGKKLSVMNIKDSQMLTESQVIERDDGRLVLYMRNHHPCRSVAVAESEDGGLSWTNFRYVDELPQSICQLSVLKLHGYDKPYVVFSNPASRSERNCGTIRLSDDDGATFKYSKVIREGEYVYSCLVQLGGDKIGVLYEPNNLTKHIDFVTFTIEDIKE